MVIFGQDFSKFLLIKKVKLQKKNLAYPLTVVNGPISTGPNPKA